MGLSRGGKRGVLQRQGAKGSDPGRIDTDGQTAGALGGKSLSQCHEQVREGYNGATFELKKGVPSKEQ
jgi:hypothetical protein